MSAYREPGEVDRLAGIDDKLTKIGDDLAEVRRDVRRPHLDSTGEFWIAMWPRLLWPMVAGTAIACSTGYACNRDTSRVQIEVAKVQAEGRARSVDADAGAPK